jgi:hypothetical protein
MNDKLVERLKKLLALAGNNPSQEEAELAMSKAQSIAIENGIDLALIGTVSNEEAIAITQETVDMGQRLPTVNVYVTNILTKFFDVRIITSGSRNCGRKLIFIGKADSITTAKYIYAWLSETMGRCWKRYYESTPGEKLTNKQSYLYGFYNGLVDKLIQNKMMVESSKLNNDSDKSKYAVACVTVASKIQSFVEDQFPTLRKTATKNIRVVASSFTQGKYDGSKCNIAKGGIGDRSVAGVLS